MGIATAAASFALIEAGLLFLQLRRDLGPLVAAANVTVVKANDTLDRVTTVANTVNVAAVAEKTYWDKTQTQVYKLITDTKLLMGRTDRSLNDILVPRLAATLDSTNSAVVRVSDNVDRVGDATVGVVSKVGPLLDAATAQVGNPEIKDSISNLADSSANISHATADASATMADVREGVHVEVKNLTAPETKMEIIWHFAIRSIGRFLRILKRSVNGKHNFMAIESRFFLR